MEQIVHQKTSEFAKELILHFGERGIYDVGEMAENALAMAQKFSSGLIAALIEEGNKALVEQKAERKADGIAIHEHDVPRTLYTALGDLTYKRTYFSTPDGMSYLIDGVLGVLPYERVDTHVSAKLANMSGMMSFGRSADIVTCGKVSRQTAWRKSMETGEVATLPQKAKHATERIHIFADEDHVHLQDGKSTILPLITVCSGKREVSKGRHELTDRVHINGYGTTPRQRWEYAYAVCKTMFDMRKIKEVYIYGDDAPWIAASDECFPHAIHVLDAQHYRQNMTGILSGKTCSSFALALYGAVRSGRRDTFARVIYGITDAVMSQMPEGKEREKRLAAVRKNSGYILSNWDAVQNMKREGSIGSCTEALVSHVFSERFSRNPMGWSKAGLSKMSMLRVFIENGGRVMPFDIGLGKLPCDEGRTVMTRVKKYDVLVNEQLSAVLNGIYDWRCFENERVNEVAPSGTKVLLDALGRRRNNL